jgi:ABC-2 type transport system ATP-binding protein
MRRRLDLAVSLISRPEVLFLDEPSTGLDPHGRLELWQTIRALATEGTTVLLTTQYLEEADQLADQIVVIDTGRIIAQGTPAQLKAQIDADRLQLRLATPATATHAAELVAELGSGPPQVDPAGGVVTLPLATGISVLPEVIRRLDAAGLSLSDLAVRRPTLDEVFLTLTGHPTQPPDPDQARAAEPAATRSPA